MTYNDLTDSQLIALLAEMDVQVNNRSSDDAFDHFTYWPRQALLDNIEDPDGEVSQEDLDIINKWLGPIIS